MEVTLELIAELIAELMQTEPMRTELVWTKLVAELI